MSACVCEGKECLDGRVDGCGAWDVEAGRVVGGDWDDVEWRDEGCGSVLSSHAGYRPKVCLPLRRSTFPSQLEWVGGGGMGGVDGGVGGEEWEGCSFFRCLVSEVTDTVCVGCVVCVCVCGV